MLKKKLELKITYETLYGISLVLFFGQDAFRVLLATVLPIIPTDMTFWVIIILMYMPLIIALLLKKSDNLFVFRFLVCLIGVALIFLVTYLIHPEYHDWFFESSYPIGNTIFRPNQFLYAFLFVSAVADPDEIIKYMKVAAYVLLAYYTYRLLKARALGYWITTTTASGAAHAAYDLNYGYDHLLVLATFTCCGVKEKKKLYFVLAAISFVEILLGGSRGPLIGTAILLALLFYRYRDRFSKGTKIIVVSAAVLMLFLLLFFGLDTILSVIGSILSRIFGNSSSRTLQMLISGKSDDLLDNSGRSRLYGMAFDMIKNGFFGYGAYGDRYVIGQVFWVGYTHNIFLEFLIDYGWLIGGTLCILTIADSLNILFRCKNESWWICFVIFFIPATKLLLSGSYWYSESFWAAIAVCLMYKRAVKEIKHGDNML